MAFFFFFPKILEVNYDIQQFERSEAPGDVECGCLCQ